MFQREYVLLIISILTLIVLAPLSVNAQETDFEVDVTAGDFHYARFVCGTNDVISGDFSATVGGVDNDIDFFVFDSENYANFQGGSSYSASLEYQKTAGRSWSFTVPYDDTWYVVYSNTYSWVTSKHVTGSHSMESVDDMQAQTMSSMVILTVIGVGGFSAILLVTYLYRRKGSPIRIQEVLLVICPHCSYKNEQTARHCSHCGALL